MSGFSDPILGGDDKLVRDAMESRNFSAGSNGWRMTAAGDAEVNQLTARGSLVTGTGQHVEITGNEIDFYSGLAGEVAPGHLLIDVTGGPPATDGYVELAAPDLGAGVPKVTLSSTPTAGLAGALIDGADGSVSILATTAFEANADLINLAAVDTLTLEAGTDVAVTAPAVSFSSDPGVLALFSETDQTRTGSTAFADGNLLEGTFVAPTSGIVFVVVSGALEATGSAGASLSFQLRAGSSSGTIIVDADQSRGIRVQGSNYAQMSFEYPVSGLTPGGTYYIKTQHNVDNAAETATIFRRYLHVKPHGAY